MKRIILGSSLLFCALFTAPAMHAQESVEVLIRENGTERQESIELPKSMTYPLESQELHRLGKRLQHLYRKPDVQ